MESGTADLPPPRTLPGTLHALPCSTTLVADEAFPLKHYTGTQKKKFHEPEGRPHYS